MSSFPDLEPVCFSMSSSNCCFLTCIQIFQEAGQMVWNSHLFKNFPQFVMIHTVKEEIFISLIGNLDQDFTISSTGLFSPALPSAPSSWFLWFPISSSKKLGLQLNYLAWLRTSTMWPSSRRIERRKRMFIQPTWVYRPSYYCWTSDYSDKYFHRKIHKRIRW